jgi:hypothetical protein
MTVKTAKKSAKPGPKPTLRDTKQFLARMDSDLVRRFKAAAAMRDVTGSVILEMAVREWLERHQDGSKK